MQRTSPQALARSTQRLAVLSRTLQMSGLCNPRSARRLLPTLDSGASRLELVHRRPVQATRWRPSQLTPLGKVRPRWVQQCPTQPPWVPCFPKVDKKETSPNTACTTMTCQALSQRMPQFRTECGLLEVEITGEFCGTRPSNDLTTRYHCKVCKNRRTVNLFLYYGPFC